MKLKGPFFHRKAAGSPLSAPTAPHGPGADRDSYRLQEAATPGVPPAGGEGLALLRLRAGGLGPGGSVSMGMNTGNGNGGASARGEMAAAAV